MEKIMINAEFLFELKSKDQWIQRVPGILPEKTRSGEKLIWVDAVGNVFESGRDFEAAEKLATYPCKVYRPCNVASGFTPPYLEKPQSTEIKKFSLLKEEPTTALPYTQSTNNSSGGQINIPSCVPVVSDKGVEDILKKCLLKYCPDKEKAEFENDWKLRVGNEVFIAMIEAMQEYAAIKVKEALGKMGI